MTALPEREDRAGQALLELGGSARPGDIGRLVGFSGATQARAIGDLVKRGLVRRQGQFIELTPKGRQVFSPLPRPDAGRLAEALKFWPHRHRAAAELLLSAVVARHHLAALEPPPGFVLLGRTGLGKTKLVEAVMELLGLDPVEHTANVHEQNEADLFGRRERLDDGWHLDPSSMTRLPLVLFDEFDKADAGEQAMVWTYFQGRRRVRRGDDLVEIHPVPVIASNPPRGRPRYSQLRAEYLRRAVLLDVGEGKTPAAMLDGLGEFFPLEGLPPWRGAFPLEQLRPGEVDAAPVRPFLAWVAQVFTEEAEERFVGARPLEVLVRGRSAIYPAANLSELALMTVADYLTVVESVEGLVRPGWHAELEQLAGRVHGASRADIEAKLDGARRALSEQAQRARAVRLHEEREDLEHVGRRSQFVAGLQRRWKALDGRSLHRDFWANPALHDRAVGVRDQLGQLKASASKSGPARLAELEQQAAGPLAAADELIATSEKLRLAEVRERERARAEKVAARARHPAAAAAARQQAKQHREYLRGQLAQVHAAVRPLERLWDRRATGKDEKPFRVLQELQALDGRPLLEFHEDQHEGGGVGGFLANAGHAIAGRPGWWRSTLDPEVRFRGDVMGCPPLAVWGPNTQRVLEPLIAFWHLQEDRLTNELGRAVHRRRPSVRPLQPPSNVRQLRPANHPALMAGDW